MDTFTVSLVLFGFNYLHAKYTKTQVFARSFPPTFAVQ